MLAGIQFYLRNLIQCLQWLYYFWKSQAFYQDLHHHRSLSACLLVTLWDSIFVNGGIKTIPNEISKLMQSKVRQFPGVEKSFRVVVLQLHVPQLKIKLRNIGCKLQISVSILVSGWRSWWRMRKVNSSP